MIEDVAVISLKQIADERGAVLHMLRTDAVVLVTRWDEFRRVPEILAHANPAPVFVYGRRMLDKQTISRYEGAGL